MTMPDDQRVIQRVLDGDTAAFRILVERYQGLLFGLIGNLLPAAEREDVAQETLLAAFDRLGDYDARRGRFATWLLTIARNKCLNALHKRRPLAMEQPPEPADPHTPETLLRQREWHRRLDAALAALPPEQQAVFVLADIQGLSYEEIGRIEDVRTGTVKSRLNRARQKLRGLLAEE